MNKNLYRIVFNKARGLLMAVAETARSHSGSVGTTEGTAERIDSPSLIATLRPLAFSLLLALGGVGLVSGVAHAAGIVADGSAPSNQQPVILNAANGVPQVNIQTPSAAGVSRNTYTQFDVQQQGVILNNSRTDVQTQLGGYVQANPYLASGAARVILNEVNSNNPSLLQGYIEVAGSRAQVVIANPAGVTCDGCGFINANRATLTTGTPILNGGSLDGYRVQRGSISITGNGLDASQTDYTDIIARAVQVNASIYANDLRVTAGSNQVNTANTTATPIAGAGTTPTLAIDVAQLGGMYAGKIQLIGTEAGVGVTNAGHIGASAGDVVVNVNGQLTNSGTISSTGNNTVQADSITNTNGNITAGQLLSINANSLTGDGHVLSNGDIAVQLNSDYTSTGQLLANGNLSFTTTGNFSNQADLLAHNTLTLNAANINNAAGHEISGANTHLNASNTLPAGGMPAGCPPQCGDLGVITNRGLIDGGDTFINAATLNNIGTGSIFGNHVAIQATTLTNDVETVNGTTTAAVIAARNSLDIGATTLNNREHSLIFSSGNMAIGGSLNAGHLATGSATTVNNNSATINALGALNLTADEINNTDLHVTFQDVTVGSQSYDQFQGQGSATRYTAPAGTPIVYNFPYCGDDCFNAYSSPHNLDAYATSVRNSLYQWVIGGAQYRNAYRFIYTETTVETQILHADPGQILSGTNMTLTASQVNNNESQIIAGQHLDDHGVALDDHGDPKVNNTTVSGQHTVTDSGTSYLYITHDPRHDDNDFTEIQTSGYNPAPTVQSLTLTPTEYKVGSTSAGKVATIGTLTTTLPNNGLFQPNPNPSANYLVETNPRFANYRTWLSSDYLLQQLSFDPATTQKRLGDGFYEQSLVRDQVAQLTGRRFLDGYASDEAEYQGLLTNAVTVGKAWNLQPGVALSAEQVAQLTSDIVWLVKKTVTLPDGSTTEALVPQVYVTVQPGDLNGSGALISGNTVNLNISGDLNNSGKIAGRTVLALNATNINNLGGTITATDVNVSATNDINNIGGTISGQDSLTATAGRDLNAESSTSTQTNSQGSTTNINRVAGLYVSNADAVLIATAGRDVNLNAAQITNSGANTNGTGGTLIQAGNNLNIGTVKTTSQENIVFNNRNNMTQTNTAEVGSNIQTNGNVTLVAGQDFNAKAATVNSTQGDVDVIANKNINITTGQSTATSLGNTSYGYGTTKSTASDTTQTTSSLSAGNNLTLQSGADTHITSATLNAGNNLAINSTGNLTIDAAKNTNTLDYDYTAKNKRDIIKNNDETAIGSQLNAGKNISLNAQSSTTQTNSTPNTSGIPAGGISTAVSQQAGNSSANLTLNSANINSQNGVVTLNADKNVTIGSTTETHDHFEQHTSKGRGFLSSKSTLSIDQVQSTNVVGSTVSGDTVAINANKDIAVQGSNVVSTNGTTLNAGENISITSTQSMDVENHVRETKKSGLMGSGGVGFTIGSRQQSTTGSSQSVTNSASTVGSTDGDVTITSGKDTNITGSDLIAGRDVNVTGRNVTIDSAYDTFNAQQSTKFKQSGLTVGVTSSLISDTQSAIDAASRGGQVQDSRLQALYGIKAAESVYKAANEAQQILNSKNPAEAFNLNITVGSSKSESTSTSAETVARGASLTAGRDLNITATGDPTSTSTPGTPSIANPTGNITLVGTTANAGRDINLAAANDINLLSAENSSTQQSNNKSSSGSIGVSISATGPSLIANAATGRGNSDGTSLTHTETTLTASDTLTIQSGRDTTLKGAVVNGNTVVADVGRNLTLQSEQDSANYKSKQTNVGGGISVGANMSGNISAGQQKTDSTYQSVIEQTSLNAGSGGFDINVAGNTALKGAVITSTAGTANNQLTTATLTAQNIENEGHYSASSVQVGLNVNGSASTGADTPAGGQPGFQLKAGLSGMAGSTEGDAAGTTQSAIAPASITITDNTKQQALTGKDAATTIASLDRDTANANGSIANPYNQQKVAEQLEFIQVAGQVILQPIAAKAAQWIGDKFPADPNNPNAIDPAKVAAHAALGAAISTLLGTGWQTGATAGALGDILPNVLAKAFEKDDNGKIKNEDAFKAASTIISAALTSATGGDLASTINAGMVTQNAVENNYLKHEQLADKRVELANAKTDAERQAIEKKYAELDKKQQQDAKDCVMDGEGCAMGANTIKTAYQELLRDCASGSPYICDADTQNSLKELNLLFADKAGQNTQLIADVFLLGGGLLKTAAGWVTKEVSLLLGMSDTLKAARSELPKRLANQGNMATSAIDIDGLPASMTASSRIDIANYGLIGEGSKNFTSIDLPNIAGNIISRVKDSEYKILDNIADQLGNNTNATGSVKIFTERPACDSCLDVANQFRNKYPNINVTIYNNNGVVLSPNKPTVTNFFNPDNVGVKK